MFGTVQTVPGEYRAGATHGFNNQKA